MENPIDVFRGIWQSAKNQGSLKHRNAVCISTIDGSGFPNSRFVDLKEVTEEGFVFCTHLDSSKALDIGRNPKTGMTAWWEHVSIQIRVQGTCSAISDEDTDAYWQTRSRDAQIATSTFDQSRVLASLDQLSQGYSRAVAEMDGRAILRPRNWGGFRLRPTSIEILKFKEDRLHIRTLYAYVQSRWSQSLLQP